MFTFQSSGKSHVPVFILTVRPPDNILQKSVLGGHKSSPTPRHAAASLRGLQMNLCCCSVRRCLSWCPRIWGAAWIWWTRAHCLGFSLSASSARCVALAPHHPRVENNAAEQSAKGGPSRLSSSAANPEWS